MNYKKRSRWEILSDVLEACNGSSGVCLTVIMRKANLNSLYTAHCIDILVKSNLLRVIDQPIGNPRQNNNTRIYWRYVKTPEGKAFIELFDKVQKMVMNQNEVIPKWYRDHMREYMREYRKNRARGSLNERAIGNSVLCEIQGQS